MQLLPKLFPQMPIATYIRFEKLLKSANNKCIARGIGTDSSIHAKCPSFIHDINITWLAEVAFDGTRNEDYHQ